MWDMTSKEAQQMTRTEKKLQTNVARKEMPAMASPAKPWVATAIEAGRSVPQWIADLSTEKQFNELMALREKAFPATKNERTSK